MCVCTNSKLYPMNHVYKMAKLSLFSDLSRSKTTFAEVCVGSPFLLLLDLENCVCLVVQ